MSHSTADGDIRSAGSSSGSGARGGKGGRDWVVRKKEQMRNKGYDVAPESKYTTRKRKRII
ncbi:hypothetical protein TSOC_001158 [Tetrabaena socialis]|uniref:18S rRNA (guanine(1575)-N(7))-methyltransferase Bud23 C-terminal domain-containing protein n=1 Tax=Tetrabaena socialis TaxID=47790 RepID=A0A2J8AHF5_9CHLO|nr:hypothetical protein TSOC_001158 [Tetrabaena socialis]|eukprot:PNH11947.1 hypothetical protein TSOC_001158 [Tetrabaena socialis]